jgi:hypothetical protein
MGKLALVALALLGIGMLLVAAIVGDASGATFADTAGYAQTGAAMRTPAMIIAEDFAQFQR